VAQRGGDVGGVAGLGDDRRAVLDRAVEDRARGLVARVLGDEDGTGEARDARGGGDDGGGHGGAGSAGVTIDATDVVAPIIVFVDA
jgi:hypothetical protein